MSTRSLIGIKNDDETIDFIYCHFDGYIVNGVGEVLYKYYNDINKIRDLISGGDISSLGRFIDCPKGHNNKTPFRDYTIFYRRDNGEEHVGPHIESTLDNFLGTDYNQQYMYLYDDGWRCFDSSEEELDLCEELSKEE